MPVNSTDRPESGLSAGSSGGSARWAVRSAWAAVGWAAVFGVLHVAWAVTGTTVPWTAHTSYPPALHLAQAALAVPGAAAAVAATRPCSRGGRRVVPLALFVTASVFALQTTALPLYVVTLASGSGVESATGLVHVLSTAIGACALVPLVVGCRRRLRGTCARCGRVHPDGLDGPRVHPPASVAWRRTRRLVYLLMCATLPWAVVKTVWTLGGDALGVTAQGWRDANASGAAKALATVGLDVTVLAALAAIFLLVGLMYPWGQVFPRWTLVLAGRRVPRLLPLVPALLTGVGLSVYGVVLVVLAPLVAVGILPAYEPKPPFTTGAGITWMILFGGLTFGGLGVALLVAARSYATRTRPACGRAAR
nr:hypothetical protein [Streptomyces sp. SID3343]